MASWELDDDKMNSQVVQGDVFDHYYHQHQDYLHVHGLSRLATCTTSDSTIASHNFEAAVDDDDDDDIHGLKTMLTRLSIEKIDDFGGDADEELSEGNNHQDKEDCLSSDYENHKSSASAQAVQGASYSLPGTPLQHMRHQSLFRNIKQYSSENETRKSRRSDRRRRWKKRSLRRENMTITDDEEQYSSRGWRESKSGNHIGGESESGVLRVITRPKGGDHPLSMDIEEVKACRELGFDLELDMNMMPSHLTVSAPVLDTGGATTSSGGSSPIPRWRISSPGDDPKEVKARLKVWAQAVALASTSPRSGGSC